MTIVTDTPLPLADAPPPTYLPLFPDALSMPTLPFPTADVPQAPADNVILLLTLFCVCVMDSLSTRTCKRAFAGET